jgi:hypothetical protein
LAHLRSLLQERRSRSALTPLALNLLARGLLPCTRTCLRDRAEPVAGRTLPFAPADTPVQVRPDLRVLQLRRPSTCCDSIRAGLPPPPVLRCASNPRHVASALTALLLRSCSFRACRAILAPFASARAVVCSH